MVGMPSGPVAGAAEPGPLPGTSERPGAWLGSIRVLPVCLAWLTEKPPILHGGFENLKGPHAGPAALHMASTAEMKGTPEMKGIAPVHWYSERTNSVN